MTCSADPNLLEQLQLGNLEAAEEIIHNTFDEICQYPVFDIFYILKTSIEGNIHPKILQLLVTGTEEDRERETQLLRLTLRNGNMSLGWMILNRWKTLERLDLSNCMLSSIPSIPSRHCETIRDLDLSHNILEVLPLSPELFPSLKTVNLEGNPLTPYPNKCRSSWSRMREYIQKLGRRSNNGIFKKVMIIGDPSSGKTSLLKALMKYFKKSTEYAEKAYINTSQVTISQEECSKEITLNVWDMGGEESAVRNFFITSRAIYILCFNMNSPDAPERVCFWLQLIQSLCKASPSDPSLHELITPVFLVGTEMDKTPSSRQTEDMKKRMQHLVSKILFRGNQGLYPVCCKNGSGIKPLIDDITKLIKRETSRSGHPENWILLNDCLHRMKARKTSFLDWKGYETLSKKCKIKKSVLQSCTTFLRDTGTLLIYFNAANFWDNKSLIILDPQWLYNLFHCIFKDNEYIQNGFLAPDKFPSILCEYPSSIQDFAMTLLSQYNIIHKLSYDKYLIPSLLSQARPSRELERTLWIPVSDDHEHHRIFEFSFLPLEFFPRVIVRLLQVKGVQGTLFWKNGVLFQMLSQNCTQKCILSYDENSYKLYIRTRISSDGGNDLPMGSHGMLFRHVIEVVEVLLESYYPRLVQSTNRLVPCTHCLARNSLNPFVFSYSQCIDAVTSGKGYLYCNDIISPSRRIPLAQLAPDVSFVDLSHISEENLEIGKEIGEGSFGFVYKGTLDGKPVAIKTLKACEGEQERLHFWEFQQESCIMSGLDHPNIVNLSGVTSNPPRLIMELLIGDLCNHLLHPIDPTDTTKQKRLDVPSYKYSWKLRMRIGYDIALGMQYLQNIHPPIIHRDLRSPNIFLASLDENAAVCAKVADFGLSRAITSSIAGSLSTWQWLAPEVILEDGGEYDISSDVYSFGIILYELVTFQFPFDEFETNPRYSRSITDGNGDTIHILDVPSVKYAIIHEQLRPTIPKDCPADISNLIERCWHQNPKKRPQFDEIVYILATELKIDLNRTKFSGKELFSRRHVSVNLSKELSSVSPSTLPDNQENEPLASFSHFVTTTDRFVSCMTTIPQSHEVWTGTSDGALIIRDSRDGSIVFSIIDAHEERITSICFVGNTPHAHVWTSSADGTIQIWDIMYRQTLKTLQYNTQSFSIKCLCPVTRSDGSVQVWSSSPRAKTLHCWNSETRELENEVSTSHQVHAMIQCGNQIWLGMEEGRITLLDCNSLQTIGSWSAGYKTIGTFCVYQNCIWGGFDSGDISMWFASEESNEELYHLQESSAHFHNINCIQKVYKTIWTASSDHSIILWDAETLVPQIEFPNAHEDSVMFILRVNPTTVWTSGTDGNIGIWNVKPPEIKMERGKMRSQSMNNERSSSRSDSLTKFTSVPMNREKRIHPNDFRSSFKVELKQSPSKLDQRKREDLPGKPTSGSRSRRMRRVTQKLFRAPEKTNTAPH